MNINNPIKGMPSGKALDMLGKLMPYIDTIINDDDYNRIRERVKSEKDTMLMDIMFDAYAAIAMKNRNALLGIVSIVTEKTIQEVEEQPIEETISVFQNVMGSNILDFFTSCARMVVRR